MALKSKDLARMLNISPSTISMVLNNKPGISNETRKKVFDKIEEMGNDLHSKRQITDKNSFIYFVIYKKHGTIITDTPFFSQLIEGVEIETKKHGLNLQITYCYANQDVSEQLPQLDGKDCKGILLLATEMGERDILYFTKLNIPIVFLDSYFDDLNMDTVVINNVQAARTAANYLLNNGHSKIGYLHSSVYINNFRERMDGFRKALGFAGIENRDEFVFTVEPTIEGAYRDIKALLEIKTPMPTAFFADNDIIAISCIKAFKEYGYKIPKDISIIGFDGIPYGEISDPPLTTMHVPKHRLAMLAVDRLVSKINGNTDEIIKIEVSANLIERNSVSKK